MKRRTRSQDCDKLRSVNRRRHVHAPNLQCQAAKWNAALAQLQLLSTSVYLFSFVLQMTRRPAGPFQSAAPTRPAPVAFVSSFLLVLRVPPTGADMLSG